MMKKKDNIDRTFDLLLHPNKNTINKQIQNYTIKDLNKEQWFQKSDFNYKPFYILESILLIIFIFSHLIYYFYLRSKISFFINCIKEKNFLLKKLDKEITKKDLYLISEYLKNKLSINEYSKYTDITYRYKYKKNNIKIPLDINKKIKIIIKGIKKCK